MQNPSDAEQEKTVPPVYFWAIGDLHYRAWEPWRTMHAARLAPMFEDLQALWHTEGAPAFWASTGDIVETGAPENYQLARRDLEIQLGSVPFFPGIGNHEFHREHADDQLHTSASAPSRPFLSSRFTLPLGGSKGKMHWHRGSLSLDVSAPALFF